MRTPFRAVAIAVAAIGLASASNAGELDLPASVVPVVGTAGEWRPESYDRNFQTRLLPTAYRGFPSDKALVFATNGVFAWAHSGRSPSQVEGRSMGTCKQLGGEGCALVAEGPKVVVPVDAYFRARATHIDVGPDFDRMVFGRADAPVSVVAFLSYSDRTSEKFVKNVFADLMKTYVEPGHVRFAWRDFPSRETDVRAGQIARCAAPDAFVRFAKTLMKARKKWKGSAKKLRAVAEGAGIAAADQERCLADADLETDILAIRYIAQTQFAVVSTPTMSINGYIAHGVTNKREAFRLIDHFLKQAGVER